MMKTPTLMLIFMAVASSILSIQVASDRLPIDDDAVARDHAIETAAIHVNSMTALQKHVSFFDRNKDGVIYPNETFEGFRAIGSGVAMSTIATALIHSSLSQKTRPGKPPSLLLPIEVSYIKRAKHGSDSGAYDGEGKFVEGKFEEIFTKYARKYKAALTEDELGAMLKGNKVPNDTAGSAAAFTEWKMLYYLCKDKNGLLHKETVRALYDGTLFYKMEKMNKKTQ